MYLATVDPKEQGRAQQGTQHYPRETAPSRQNQHCAHHNWEAGKGRQIKLTGNAQFIKKAQGHKIFPCPSTKKLFQIPNSLAACKSFTSGPTPCRQAVSDVPIYQVPRSADEGTGLEDTCRANRPHSWESALLTPAQEESNLPPHNNLSVVLYFHKCIEFPHFCFLMRHFTKMPS